MPRVLDLFCGGGGAAVGYNRAGFEVVGVDIKRQPSYPFEFIQMDWREALRTLPMDFDLIHASPPCQGYSSATTNGMQYPRLILPVRTLLRFSGIPYVIENVTGAQYTLQKPALLCGTMFGLPISRHRLFETSFLLTPPVHYPVCEGIQARYARERGWDPNIMTPAGHGSGPGTTEKWSEIMGIDWKMRLIDLAEAIPPSYTRFVGEEWLKTSGM